MKRPNARHVLAAAAALLVIAAPSHAATNQDLAGNVQIALITSEAIDGTTIFARADGPTVTLIGAVESEADKQTAERIARGVPGVSNVVNQIAVVPETLTYVTYSFLHGDIFHLGGNMLFLWVFGDNIEDALGHVKFLVFYLLCAAAGALFHGLLAPLSQVPLIGASGAIAGVVTAYLILHPRVKIWILAFARIPLRTGFRGEWHYGLLNDVRVLEARLDQTVKRFVALGLPSGAAVPDPLTSLNRGPPRSRGISRSNSSGWKRRRAALSKCA